MRILGSWLHRTPRDRVVLSLSLERVLLARATPDWVFAEERCQGQADWARAMALFPVCVGACLYLKQALKSEVPCYGNQQLL